MRYLYSLDYHGTVSRYFLWVGTLSVNNNSNVDLSFIWKDTIYFTILLSSIFLASVPVYLSESGTCWKTHWQFIELSPGPGALVCGVWALINLLINTREKHPPIPRNRDWVRPTQYWLRNVMNSPDRALPPVIRSAWFSITVLCLKITSTQYVP